MTLAKSADRLLEAHRSVMRKLELAKSWVADADDVIAEPRAAQNNIVKTGSASIKRSDSAAV